MKRIYLTVFLAVFLALSISACGSSQNSNLGDPINSLALSRENAIQCLDKGDLSCAKTNYCGLQAQNPSDPQIAFRCCVSQFLNVSFSDNSQALGKMLGYHPASFATIKGASSLNDLISQKKIIFGELIFLPQGQAPRLRDLIIDWGGSLISKQASTQELNQRVTQWGSDMESVSQCLSNLPASFPNDQLEGNFFGSKDKISITKRDILFLQFASAGLSYLTQSIFQYDWGVANFPSLPLADSFYEDVNGNSGSGDKRFGDLSSEGAQKIIAKSKLLQISLGTFENFLHESNTGLMDLWLRWRFSQDELVSFTSILRSAAASVSQGAWMSVSGKDFILNTSSLLNENTLPNANTISPSLDLVLKKSDGDPELNSDYLERLFVNQIHFTESSHP